MKEDCPFIHITKHTPLKVVLELGKECKQRDHCCQFGGGFVIKEDIPKIANFLNIKEEEFKEKYLTEVTQFNTTLHKIKSETSDKQYAPCIFYDKKEHCMIHEVKPLHCRIGNCGEYGQQLSLWFMLNYFLNPDDPESIRQYATYLKTQPTLPGAELENLLPDKKKLKKILNYEIIR
jgi:Fe-S-cluster containining protein